MGIILTTLYFAIFAIMVYEIPDPRTEDPVQSPVPSYIEAITGKKNAEVIVKDEDPELSNWDEVDAIPRLALFISI